MNPALLALILTQAQGRALNLSYNIGSKYGYPLTVAALIWQESSFCARTHHPDGSYGCAGIRLPTASLSEARNVSPAELEQPETNIRIALGYYLKCRAQSDSWRRSIAEYHYGIPKGSRMSQKEIDSDRYVLSVAAKVKMLEQVRVDTQ